MFNLKKYIELSKEKERLETAKEELFIPVSVRMNCILSIVFGLIFYSLPFWLFNISSLSISETSFFILLFGVFTISILHSFIVLRSHYVLKNKFIDKKLLNEIKIMENSIEELTDDKILILLKESDDLNVLDYKYFHYIFKNQIKKKYKEFTELDYLIEKTKMAVIKKDISNE